MAKYSWLSYITSLKPAIAGKSLISAGLDIDRILHFVFMIKYSKFTDNIGSGNCVKISTAFLKSGWGGGGGSVKPPYPSLSAWYALDCQFHAWWQSSDDKIDLFNILWF